MATVLSDQAPPPTRVRTEITDELFGAIVRMYKAGVKAAEIAHRLQLSKSTVANVWREHKTGVPRTAAPERPTLPGRPNPDPVLERARRRAAQIADALSCPAGILDAYGHVPGDDGREY